MKKKYLVGIREVHVSWRKISASSKEEAIKLVGDDVDNEEVYMEYSHTLDEEYWTVEEVNE